MSDTKPQLTWEINGHYQTAWVNDLEVMTIGPSAVVLGHYELRISHVGHAQSVTLGYFLWRGQAQAYAEMHIREETA